MIPPTLEKFQETLKETAPDVGWPEALQALWWDAKGDWNASHNIAQEIPTSGRKLDPCLFAQKRRG